ncbi:MAG: hypothetical protein ACT4OM_09140 [Actinomycetota bacterium]
MGEKVWGLSKEQVNYRPAKRETSQCDACVYMFPKLAVGTCKLVRGGIKASYTCNAFKS